MQRSYDYVLKFVMVGSSSVGKSSILRRFADDQYIDTYVSTIGIDFKFKSMHIDDCYVKLQIWDTAGQQRFRGMTNSYYKGANCIIIVYDITNPTSFDDVVTHWIKQTKQNSPNDRIFCFINKCDQGEATQINQQHLSFLKLYDIKWFKVSAKKSYQVTQSIISVARQIMEKQPKLMKKATSGFKLAENHATQQQSNCCIR